MRFIRSFFSTIFFLSLGLGICVYFLVNGEDQYRQNCEKLGIECESGQALKKLDSYWTQVKDFIKKLRP